MAKVLAISSHVVRGHVGLAASVPALQLLGHEVWALPTVLLASRPGLGRLERLAISGPELARMLAALEADGCWPQIDAVFTGYFPSPDSVAAAAAAIASVKAARPTVRCSSIRSSAMADASTWPRRRPRRSAIACCRSRQSQRPICSSCAGSPEAPRSPATRWRRQLVASVHPPSSSPRQRRPKTAVSTLLVAPDGQVDRQSPKRPGIPNGAGDLFAGHARPAF